ncbi:MAG: bifunctional phosphoribosylaminoimidazolecarboxamide formyltransferase/IMP cyclohydrolase, partial [Acidobacteriota bacterium]
MTANTDTGRYALLSVYDKKGILSLARGLIDTGFRILSTGGTAAALRQEDIPVQEVSEYTGFPEILGGRVKTLHPKIHGGILGRPDRQADLQEMELQGIRPIQLLVVNLYPFAKVAADPQSTPERLVEMIDIGGPTMI